MRKVKKKGRWTDEERDCVEGVCVMGCDSVRPQEPQGGQGEVLSVRRVRALGSPFLIPLSLTDTHPTKTNGISPNKHTHTISLSLALSLTSALTLIIWERSPESASSSTMLSLLSSMFRYLITLGKFNCCEMPGERKSVSPGSMFQGWIPSLQRIALKCEGHFRLS